MIFKRITDNLDSLQKQQDLRNELFTQEVAKNKKGNYVLGLYAPGLDVPQDVLLDTATANQLGRAYRPNAQAVLGALPFGANQGRNAMNEQVNLANYTMPDAKESAETGAFGSVRNLATPAAPATAKPSTGYSPKFGANVSRWAPQVRQISKGYGVDPNLVLSVIQQESGGNPNAGSAVGARGLMQLMPSTARGLGVNNASDPKQNLNGGIKMLGNLIKQHGDYKVALAAYNGGSDGVAYARSGFDDKVGQAIHAKRKARGSYFDYKQVKNYVKAIDSVYRGGGGASPASKAIVASAKAAGVADPESIGAARVRLSAQGALPTDTGAFQAQALPPGDFIPPEVVAAMAEGQRLGITQGAGIAEAGYKAPYLTQQTAMQTALAPYATQLQAAEQARLMRSQEEAQKQNVLQNELKRLELEQRQEALQQERQARQDYQNSMLDLARQESEQKQMQAMLAQRQAAKDSQIKSLTTQQVAAARLLNNKNLGRAERLSLMAKYSELSNRLGQLTGVGGGGGDTSKYGQAMAEIGR